MLHIRLIGCQNVTSFMTVQHNLFADQIYHLIRYNYVDYVIKKSKLEFTAVGHVISWSYLKQRNHQYMYINKILYYFLNKSVIFNESLQYMYVGLQCTSTIVFYRWKQHETNSNNDTKTKVGMFTAYECTYMYM